VQEAAEALGAETATTPTNTTATTIAPRRNFDFNNLLINFYNFSIPYQFLKKISEGPYAIN
jgi:hypothetical protein